MQMMKKKKGQNEKRVNPIFSILHPCPILLARETTILCTNRPCKTSIVFVHDKGTSMLFKVLFVFTFCNINLTKIESRPHRNRPIRLVDDTNVGTSKHLEYLFYIDFEASMAEVKALEKCEMKRQGSGKGKREDAWTQETLGDRVSEKNKVARKWVREFLEKVTTSIFQ